MGKIDLAKTFCKFHQNLGENCDIITRIARLVLTFFWQEIIQQPQYPLPVVKMKEHTLQRRMNRLIFLRYSFQSIYLPATKVAIYIAKTFKLMFARFKIFFLAL